MGPFQRPVVAPAIARLPVWRDVAGLAAAGLAVAAWRAVSGARHG